MNTITDLKYKLGGGARTNKFSISINKPLSVATLDGDKDVENNLLTFLATNTSIPEKSISTVNIMHRGRKYLISDISQFQDIWSITFYNDAQFKIRKYFEDWMYDIDRYDTYNGTDSVVMSNLANMGYMQDISVTQLCGDGSNIATYHINHAWPCRIHDIALNSEESNQISKTTVDFAYSHWTRPQPYFKPVEDLIKGIQSLPNNISKSLSSIF